MPMDPEQNEDSNILASSPLAHPYAKSIRK